MRFVLFVAFVAFLGWCLDNIVSPWMDLKLLEWRARREMEQQWRLRSVIQDLDVTPQPITCICEWFDHDTLIVDPRCKASDHGQIQAKLDQLKRVLTRHCADRRKFNKE